MTDKSGRDDYIAHASLPVECAVEVKALRRQGQKGDAFVSGGATELYEPIPQYEGIHRYDPAAEWTEKEERKLVRRVSDVIAMI